MRAGLVSRGRRAGGLTGRTRLVAVAALGGVGLLFGSPASAAPFAAEASVAPTFQYLADKSGTVFTFTIKNTGTDKSIGAVEISRPGTFWRITGCPSAPTGWSATRSDTMCRYASKATTTDDIAAGATSSAFQVKATTGGGVVDVSGTWGVVVSQSNRFDNPSLLMSASAPPGALNLTAHSFEILDAIVVTTTATPGAVCPAGEHKARAGATNQTVVICGRNRTNRTLTPVASQASLAGTFVAGSGTFTSGPVAKTGTSGNVVLGTWTGVTITGSSGTGKTVVAKVGSAPDQTSPLTTLTGYEAENPPPVATPQSVSLNEDGSLGIVIAGTDPENQPLTFAIATPTANGTLGALGAPSCGVGGCTASVLYTPNANFFGSDSFTFTAHDGTTASAPATVSITVAPVNDEPSFTTGPSVTVLEDAGPQSSGWATNVSPGPANESGQTVTFFVSNSNNALFSVQPALAPDGTLTFTPAPDANGSANVTVVALDDGGNANGGDHETDPFTFVLNVTPVNDAPSFTKGAGQTVNEDAATQTVPGWATAISSGPPNESGQSLTFSVSNDNNALFSVQPAVSATGTLTFTPATDAFGSATVSVTLSDNGGTANGGDDTSDAQTFAITVDAVNDAPRFTKGADQQVLQDAGAQTVTGWATAISAGPANESGQTLTFTVTNDKEALFSAQPAVSPAGNLTYTPAAGASGSATVSVTLSDDGGTANGGVDTSATQTFTITVNGIPTADATSASGNEDAGAIVVTLTGHDADGDALTFIVGTATNGLVSVPGAVNCSGTPSTCTTTVSYTPNANFFGADSFTYKVNDGTVDSAPATASITVNPVNDAPSFTKGADQTVNEDAGAQTVAGWATAISAGPANESGQTVAFNVVNDNNGLFSVQPGVDATTGDLTYTPAANANGVATVSLTLSDDGGTANGGMNTSAAQTFTITVTAVNDAPAADATSGSGNEDAGGIVVTLTGHDVDGNALTFDVGTATNGLVSVPGAVNCSGTPSTCTTTVTYTPNANFFGADSFTYKVNDGTVDSALATASITVNSVNDAPIFTKGADQTVLQDSGAQTVSAWATAISAGPVNEAGQTLTFAVTNGNTALFSAQPDVDESTGDLTYTPAPTATGTATVSVTLSDNGGTANGGVDTSTQTFTITVVPPNAAPTADATSASGNEDGGAIVVTLTGHDGDGDALTFLVGTASNGLVSVPGAVNCSGTPSTCTTTVNYTPNANYFGSDSFTYTVNDGVVDSAPATASITVNPVNDAPTFTKGADQTVNEDAGPQTVPGWATGISAGPANESDQTVAFSVINDNNGLFAVLPGVGGDGTLTYTPASNVSGSATVSLALSDDGGTANGGVNTSAVQTFTITVNAVNDAPSFTKGADQTLNEDAGAQSVSNWATAISKGPADESAQTLTFNVTNDDNALFSAQPAVSPTGTLTFTSAPNAHGSATVTVTLSDNGGTANGGVNTSDTQTFTITVNAVNDAPTAVAKAYNVQANMKISLGGLLTGAADANDTAANPGYTPTFTVGSVTPGAGCVGCTVSNVNSANGTFDFDPPAGGTGTFTLDYTVVDSGDPGPGATSAPQTITMTVNGPVIWFVNAAAGPGGTGRLSAPFSTLAGAAAVDAANHRIFVAPGTYADGITLLAGEWLTGSGAEAASFDALMGITPPAGTIARPAVNTTAPTVQGAVTLGSNNTVRGLSLSGATALSGSSFGTLTLGAGANADVALTSTGQALSLTTGTVSGDFLSTSSSGGTNNVLLSSVTSTGTSLGTGALSSATSEGLRITGGAGTFSYAGTVANATGATVSIANKTGGTVTLSGAVSDTAGAGVSLSANTGATVNFTGGVNLTSGTSAAFAATGGGTVSVTGSANTLASTTGTALNIANTTIGAADVTFRSISSNGATKGIVLDTTGSSGNLVVTGNGGTCTAANTSGCSGGTIASSTGGDDSSSSPVGTGIVLNDTRDVSLTRMFVNGSTNYGIRGSSVVNLSLVDSVIGGTNGTNAASPFNDGSAMFTGLTGTVAFTRVEASGGFGSNIEITNTSGTLNSTFDAVRIGANSTTDGNDGLQVEGIGTATVNATIQNSFFTSARGDLVQYIGGGSGGGSLTMTGNTLTNNHPAIATGGGGVTLSGGASGPVTMNISANTSRDAVGHAWLIVKNPGSGSITGTFDGNTVGVAATANSGSLEGDGLKIQHAGTGTMSFAVTNNAIRQYNNYGIDIQAGAGAVAGGTLSVTNLSGNTVSNPGNNPAFDGVPFQGVVVNSGVTPGDTFVTCVNFGANTVTGSGHDGGHDVRVRQRQSTTIRLPGYAGGATDTTAVVNFLLGKLGGAPVVSATVESPPGGGFVGTAC